MGSKLTYSIKIKDKTDKAAAGGVAKMGSLLRISKQELIATSLLCIYSIIEGLVVGLALKNNEVWQLFAVILVHHIITSLR